MKTQRRRDRELSFAEGGSEFLCVIPPNVSAPLRLFSRLLRQPNIGLEWMGESY